MTETIENLEQQVRLLQAKLNIHLNNPAAHRQIDPLSTEKVGYAADNGFVNRDQLAQAMGMPRYVAEGTSVFSLPTGFFKCYQPTDMPATANTKNKIAWFIQVNKPNEDDDPTNGQIIAINSFGATYFAHRIATGWAWSRYEDKTQLGEGLTNSWYSTMHFAEKIMVHIHVDIKLTLPSRSYSSNLATAFPKSLWKNDWDGSTDKADPISAVAMKGNTYIGSIVALFGPSISILNTTDQAIDRVIFDHYYEIDNY